MLQLNIVLQSPAVINLIEFLFIYFIHLFEVRSNRCVKARQFSHNRRLEYSRTLNGSLFTDANAHTIHIHGVPFETEREFSLIRLID